MKVPSMRSEVSVIAMPRTRGAVSAKNFSRSLASENLSRLKAGASPLTMTGFGGPISNTSLFSSAITFFLQALAVDPSEHDAHEDDRGDVEARLLEHEPARERHHDVMDEIDRDGRQHRDGDAVADALRQPRLSFLALEVDPGEADGGQQLRQQHQRELAPDLRHRSHQTRQLGVVAGEPGAVHQPAEREQHDEHDGDGDDEFPAHDVLPFPAGNRPQTNAVTGCSTNPLNAASSSAPSAPSTTR